MAFYLRLIGSYVRVEYQLWNSLAFPALHLGPEPKRRTS